MQGYDLHKLVSYHPMPEYAHQTRQASWNPTTLAFDHQHPMQEFGHLRVRHSWDDHAVHQGALLEDHQILRARG
jgi:hypothetical protein